jgi:tetratricopeptide (TPR) repeat protein
VFDNIVSYIYYGTILAFIHARIGLSSKKITDWKIDQRIIEQVVTPVVGVALLATLYFVNIPGLRASGDIIDAFKQTTPDGMLSAFNVALDRESFGDQEIREQMTRRVQEMVQAKGTTDDQKKRLVESVEKELLKQIEEKPGDARAHVFIASFYRMMGTPEALDKAVAQLEIARSLSPRKQQIIFEQGLVQLQKQQYENSFAFFKEAYELDTSYSEAGVYYAMAAVYLGKNEIVDEVIVSEDAKNEFAQNDLVAQAVYTSKNYPLLLSMFERRIANNPTEPQFRTSYAYILNESGDTAKAIEVLKKAAEDIPSFKTQAEQFMQQIVSQNLGIQTPEQE